MKVKLVIYVKQSGSPPIQHTLRLLLRYWELGFPKKKNMELSHFICVVKYSLESPKTAREVPSAPAMLALWRVRNQRLGCKTLGRQIILKMAQFSICGTFYVLKKNKTACCQILFHLPTDVANSCKTCHLWHTII